MSVVKQRWPTWANWVLVIWACLHAPSSAGAVTIVLKGQSQPMHGYLVRQDADTVVVRLAEPDGTWREQAIDRSQIELFHLPVDPERLAALQPERPKEYRDYAEELAEKRVDPEAREAGLRLFLIAAYLDPTRLGRSCLLGMIPLARDPDEERRFRAMAYLLDPGHDRGLLAAPEKSVTENSAAGIPPGAERLAALRCLELLRKGAHAEAYDLARRPGVDAVFHEFGGPGLYSDLLAVSRDRRRLADPTSEAFTVRILRMEYRLLAAESDVPIDAFDVTAKRWSEISETELAKSAKPLSLEFITEFDPRECVFREGKWERTEAR